MNHRDCLEQQLDELELLQSVFSQPGEYTTTDQTSVDYVTAWIRGLTSDPPVSRLSCVLRLSVDAIHSEEGDEHCAEDGAAASSGPTGTIPVQCSVNISITLPHSYPSERPEVYVSSDHLSRRGQDNLNVDMREFIATLPLGEVCLLNIAEWVRDNVSSYCPITTPQSDTLKLDSSGGDKRTFCRLWLYMHHIYSKTKRRNILDLADELELSGFCLPGKPGVVCVEGDESSTKHFYNILRRWNWKSISCRHRELVPECSDMSSQRQISGFQELELVTHGPKQNHMDMGQFRVYLEDHGLGYMFSQLFGVEGQVS